MSDVLRWYRGGHPLFDGRIIAAAGDLNGFSLVDKFGRNTDVDTSEEDVHDAGGTWVAPTEARVHNIASTDAGDAAAGAGARTIRVWGLTDWATNEVSEDITMNGVTDVATTNSYVIIHRMSVLTWGATNVNIGTITATAVTDATVTAQIPVGFGQTQMAIYGVPSTKMIVVYRVYSNVFKTSGSSKVDNKLLVNHRPDAELTNFITKHTFVSTDTSGEVPSYVTKVFDGPCIVKVSANSSALNTDVGAGFDALLVTKSS